MNITVTGSLGHISKPLTEELLQQGHSVTVISSSAEREPEIEALGANAAIGLVEDTAFLADTFEGADAVYLMEPPINYAADDTDMQQYWTNIAEIYVEAVRRSGVTNLVHLSSIGAHTTKGNGMLSAHHEVENILRKLEDDVSIKFMRPVGFYYNMLAFIPTIKARGVIIQNYGGDKKEPWVSPLDIAAVIAREIEKPFEGRAVRYIASDEVSPNEVAKILGEAIGKPDLEWTVISDEQFQDGLIEAGFTPKAAKGMMEMNAGRRNKLYEDYYQNRPTLGKVKMIDYAKEFAHVFQNK